MPNFNAQSQTETIDCMQYKTTIPICQGRERIVGTRGECFLEGLISVSRARPSTPETHIPAMRPIRYLEELGSIAGQRRRANIARTRLHCHVCALSLSASAPREIPDNVLTQIEIAVTEDASGTGLTVVRVDQLLAHEELVAMRNIQEVWAFVISIAIRILSISSRLAEMTFPVWS